LFPPVPLSIPLIGDRRLVVEETAETGTGTTSIGRWGRRAQGVALCLTCVPNFPTALVAPVGSHIIVMRWSSKRNHAGFGHRAKSRQRTRFARCGVRPRKKITVIIGIRQSASKSSRMTQSFRRIARHSKSECAPSAQRAEFHERAPTQPIFLPSKPIEEPYSW
jgi:hypothetical protein